MPSYCRFSFTFHLGIPCTFHSFTDAVDTIKALEKNISSFGIAQKLVYDKDSAFMNQDFTSYIHELGITLAPRTAYSSWTNGKVEIQNKHLGANFRIFLEQARGKWDELAPKFAFSHNKVPNASTGISPYEKCVQTKTTDTSVT